MQNLQRLSRVRSLIYGQPWNILPEWLDSICEIFERHASLDEQGIIAAIESAVKIGGGNSARLRQDEYPIQNGVAVVRLMGPIFPRANMMTQLSGATSIEQFASNFSDALENNDVNAVFLHVDSPGGSVLGLDNAANKIFSARSNSKPVIGLIDGLGASAAYLVSSQCDMLYCTESSMVGSIGTVMTMEDDTRQAENDGVKRITLKSGTLKAIGAGPITDEQVQHMKGILDDYFGQFKAAVSRARPQVNLDTAATGEVWIGKKALDMKLVDGISSFDEIMNQLTK